MKNKFVGFSLLFSILALIISILTFLKTGGVTDIRQQINLMKNDIVEVKAKTEIRMENRSLLFDALCDLTDSVDSLKTGRISEAKRLTSNAIEKITAVEKQLTQKKRKHLENIRKGIEKISSRLKPNDIKIVEKLEYQIVLLRIFEENL